MFVVLVAAGRLADVAYLAMGGLPVSPSGLASGAWTIDQRNKAQQAVVRSVAAFSMGTSAGQGPIAADRDPSELRTIVDAAYLEFAEKAKGAASTSVDARYRQTRLAVDLLRPRGPAEACGVELVSALRQLGNAVFGLSPSLALDAAFDGFLRTPAALIRFAPWFSVLAGLPLLAIVSVLGGGLARMSVWETGRNVKLSIADAARFVRKAWIGLVLVPAIPALVAIVGLFFIAVVGALLRVPILDLVGGMLYGLVLLLTILMVIGGTCFVVGWPLAIASVSAGDGDAIDAIVRSNAYLIRRPGTSLVAFASVITAVALGLALAGGTASLALSVAESAVGFWGGGGAARAAGDAGLLVPAMGTPPLSSATARAAAGFIDLWELIAILFVGGAALTAAASRAYLVLRLACDGQDPSALDGVSLGRQRVK